ncbi:Pectinesterase inhibitor domain-containing protein [Hirschfeldia incana]|nr:Pectinesterase inhibitor domain-containing protein [Hirschfeldia incana]
MLLTFGEGSLVASPTLRASLLQRVKEHSKLIGLPNRLVSSEESVNVGLKLCDEMIIDSSDNLKETVQSLHGFGELLTDTQKDELRGKLSYALIDHETCLDAFEELDFSTYQRNEDVTKTMKDSLKKGKQLIPSHSSPFLWFGCYFYSGSWWKRFRGNGYEVRQHRWTGKEPSGSFSFQVDSLRHLPLHLPGLPGHLVRTSSSDMLLLFSRAVTSSQGCLSRIKSTPLQLRVPLISSPMILSRMPFAKVLVMKTYLEDIVDLRGWIAWNKEAPPTTLRYGEYKNSGPGSALSNRVNWTGYEPIMTDEEAQTYSVDTFINRDGWLNQTCIPYDPTV